MGKDEAEESLFNTAGGGEALSNSNLCVCLYEQVRKQAYPAVKVSMKGIYVSFYMNMYSM